MVHLELTDEEFVATYSGLTLLGASMDPQDKMGEIVRLVMDMAERAGGIDTIMKLHTRLSNHASLVMGGLVDRG